MGRKKIQVQQITDPKLRNITYNKRKNGLVKKAAEIALLCNINIMLVFEDLNGNLVQFSRDHVKSFAQFDKERNYKRVLQLTAEDYPDFSRIRRHKKRQGTPEHASSQASTVPEKPNARTLVEMFSEQDSIIAKEEHFSNDADNIGSYFSTFNFLTGPLDSIFQAETQPATSFTPKSQFYSDHVRKAVKTTTSAKPTKIPSPKDSKNKPNLRLNIPKSDDPIKDAMKLDSKGSRRKASSNSKKPNSSQKNYVRKSGYEPTPKSSIDKKTDIKMSTCYPFMTSFEAQNQLNIRFGHHMMSSPNNDLGGQRRARNSVGMNEEEIGVNFTEFSPFCFQAIGTTPPAMKQNIGEDPHGIEKIANYLSHTGRTPPHHNNIFTFQQSEYQRMGEGSMPYEYGMENQVIGGMGGHGALEGGYDYARYTFDGYVMENDQRVMMDRGESMFRMKI